MATKEKSKTDASKEMRDSNASKQEKSSAAKTMSSGHKKSNNK